MSAATSIPYLEANAVVAAIKRIDARDTAHPLLPLFPRKQQRGSKITLRYLSRKPGQVRQTSYGGQAMPVRVGTLSEKDYEPSVIKLFAKLNREDVTLFVDAAKAESAQDVGTFGESTIKQADDRIMEIAGDLGDDNSEERHRMCAGALQGTFDYVLENYTGTVNYGLTALTAPSTLWSNIGAKIVTDMFGAFEEFRDGNGKGLSPNVAFYNPKMYSDFFLQNTEWQTYKKQNPELAQGFLRIAGGRVEADMNGWITDPLFGLTWIKIEGTYVDLTGANVARWPANKLVLARLGQSALGQYWAMVQDELQVPRAETNIEISNPRVGDDVKVHKVISFDNGLPVFKDPELVMPWTVGA